MVVAANFEEKPDKWKVEIHQVEEIKHRNGHVSKLRIVVRTLVFEERWKVVECMQSAWVWVNDGQAL